MKIGGGGNSVEFWIRYGPPMIAGLLARIFYLPLLVLIACALAAWLIF